MSKFIPPGHRIALTQKHLHESELDIDANTAVAAWWWDARPGNGLRLTDLGFDVFVSRLDLEHWQFDIADSVLTPRNLLALDRFMTCPYYLRRQRRQHSLILFGDRESVMASLYGDVERFIASLEH